MVHSISGWTQGVQVKFWDPKGTCAIPERLRCVHNEALYKSMFTVQWSYLTYLYIPPLLINCNIIEWLHLSLMLIGHFQLWHQFSGTCCHHLLDLTLTSFITKRWKVLEIFCLCHARLKCAYGGSKLGDGSHRILTTLSAACRENTLPRMFHCHHSTFDSFCDISCIQTPVRYIRH